MSKAKKPAKDAKNPAEDENEWKGPIIWQELLTKQVPELEVNLNAPTDILNNENIEFEILVERIQQTCARLDKDNQRLENLILKAD